VAGVGPALLVDSGWVSHVLAQLERFSFGSVVDGLAKRFTVIRYDKPGCGLSDREGIDLSFDGPVAAALAGADATGAERFHLPGTSDGGRRGRGEETAGTAMADHPAISPPYGSAASVPSVSTRLKAARVSSTRV
jgi:pimeloyl-ACP methyl ester carboxylesterase